MISGGGYRRRLKHFDFVFTNPPFGADIKIKHRNILEKYALGHKWIKDSHSQKWHQSGETEPTDPQILFLELCLNLLNEGGKMCIVLPESVLGNPTQGYVRQWLLETTTILAIWDCPSLLFQPHTSTKTCILFIEKVKTPHQSIMMSVIKKCGHDSRGAEIRNDNQVLVEDFSKALADWKNKPSEIGNFREWKGEVSILVSSQDVANQGMLVPRIYQLEHQLGAVTKTLGDLEKQGILSLKTMPCGVKQSEYDDENGEIPYIRTSDLGVMELRPSHHKVPLSVYEREQAKQDLGVSDLLMVKDGGHRIGETVMLSEEDLDIVVQGHFYKIRVLNPTLLDPYFLLYALRKTQPFIAASSIIQVTLGSITIDRLRDIPIPYPNEEKRKEIAAQMREILEERQIRRKNLDKI